MLSWVQKYANNKSIQSSIPTKNASVPKHASEFLSQVACIVGTYVCTYVFEHARPSSVMSATLIEDITVANNNFWTFMPIHVFSLVLSSSWWASAENYAIFPAHISTRYLLHPLLADRLTSRSMPIQKSAPHANVQELRPSVESASHLSIIRVYWLYCHFQVIISDQGQSLSHEYCSF